MKRDKDRSSSDDESRPRKMVKGNEESKNGTTYPEKS